MVIFQFSWISLTAIFMRSPALGTSENAVKIQVWTALIAILMTKYLKFLSKAEWHFSTLVTFLKWNLFVYRDLRQWLNQPFTKPPEPESFQPEFSF